jgi:hypothetical protein
MLRYNNQVSRCEKNPRLRAWSSSLLALGKRLPNLLSLRVTHSRAIHASELDPTQELGGRFCRTPIRLLLYLNCRLGLGKRVKQLTEEPFLETAFDD